MITDLAILYRGPLSSCNYGCPYCPFAKHFENETELLADKSALMRFTQWAEQHYDIRLSILFTPWGEALVRKWYQQAMTFLTHLPNVAKVAAQTNLSFPLDWLENVDKNKLALWATFHPGETTRDRFLKKCERLVASGIRFSAGVVGLKEHQHEIEALRRELPPQVYLWINAYKRVPEYYTAEEIARFEAVDPLFTLNNQRHASKGASCRAGASVISVDGDGTMRRCHFVREPLGNLYAPDWRDALAERPCPNETCGCHIGYVHLDRLGLYPIFGAGVLERIPDNCGRSSEGAALVTAPSGGQVSAIGR
jgi:MoaA/NifB/PqqE/SkfB family radical SAM enzyme